MNKTVSIIVPCFNTAVERLKKCLASILKQTVLPDEIIISDDGSTDETLLQYYEDLKKNKLIKILLNEHFSQSSACYFGVINAKSDYIMFLDSDDTLNDDCIKTFINNIGNCDLLCSGYKKVYTTKFEDYVLEKHVYENEADMKFLKNHLYFDDNSFDAFKFTNIFRWSKLFKREICLRFIDKYHELNFGMYEDMFFVYNYVCECNSVKTIDYLSVNYIQYEDSFSIAKSISLKELDDLITKVESSLKYLQKKYSLEDGIFDTLYFDISKYYVSRLIKGRKYSESKKFFKQLNKVSKYREAIKTVNIKNSSFKRKLYFYFLKYKMFLPIYLQFKN